MKKEYWAALALVLVLALGLFAVACGGGTETTTTAANTATTAAGSTDTTAAASTDTTGAGSTDTTAAANTTPIKIGIAISLTGNGAAPCQQIKQGFDTEAKFINANGGINGRQVELVYIDDQSKMDASMAAVQALIDQKADVIIGPFPAWCQPSARPVTEQAGVLHIVFGPATISELLEDQSKYTYSFSLGIGPDASADAFTRQLQAGGYKSVVAFGDQMVPSQEGLKLTNIELNAVGIKCTLSEDSWGLDETDLRPVATKYAQLIEKENPDAVILDCNPTHVNQMTKILREMGVKQPIFNGGAGAHPLVMLGAAGNDPAVVAGDYVFGPAIVNPAAIPDAYSAKADLVAFIQRWQADNPKEPFASIFLGFAYDTIHLAEQAIKNAPTQDAKGYAEGMAKMDWWGAQGHYLFSTTEHNGVHGGFFDWQYTNGQGFKFLKDLNAMSDPVLLPATVDALNTLK